ncbi:MAG TPA: hypothetical protein VK009_18275 [Chloroflexota bacterium]|nr:hypothetical protein [Chloroflexota bacterium]
MRRLLAAIAILAALLPTRALADDAAPQPTVINGNYSQTVPLTIGTSGVALFKLDYPSINNFIVRLINETGGVTTLANQIGPWSGTTATGLPAGSYKLAVTGYGPWTVTVWNQAHWQGTPTSATGPFTGSGMDVVTVNLNAGTTVFGLHFGAAGGNYTARLLRDDGSLITVLTNQIGQTSPWAVNVPVLIDTPGTYLVAFDATGPWSLNLLQPS